MDWVVGMGPGWAAVLGLLAGLAGARLTQLAVDDKVTEPGRLWVLRRLDADNSWHRWLAYFMTCRWCVSIWIGTAIVVAVDQLGGNRLLWGAFSILALSQMTGMLGDIKDFLKSRTRQ